MTSARFEGELDRLAALLRARGPLTAAQVARALKCCKPAAYARIRALSARESVYQVSKPRKGKRGPVPVAYGLSVGGV